MNTVLRQGLRVKKLEKETRCEKQETRYRMEKRQKEGIKKSVKMETWKYGNNEPRRRETLNVKR